MNADVRVRDWLLAALAVSSGAVDAISFLALGKVFTAFMTGNIVFLGMALAGNAAAPNLASVLLSLAGFTSGVFVGTRVVMERRTAAQQGGETTVVVWPRRATVGLGVSLVAQLGFMVVWVAAGGKPDENITRVLLVLWAVAMGMQSAAVRGLDVGGVFTTAATATLIFLVGDFARGTLTGEARRHLLGVLVSLAVGATLGVLVLDVAPLYAPVFPLLVAGGVVVVAGARWGRGGVRAED